MKKNIILISLAILAIVLTACSTDYVVDSIVQEPVVDSFESCVNATGVVMTSYPAKCSYGGQTFVENVTLDVKESLSDSCTSIGGNWLEDSSECEGIPKDTCTSLGGEYNECASACRNDPDAVMCTMQCVLVCDFDTSSSDVEVFEIGPELRSCVGVGPQDCMVVNGNNFYDSISGFTYEEGFDYKITVKKELRENVPADASSYSYTLVEVISKTPVNNVHTCTEDELTNLVCTREYNPVCGNNNVTYSTGCTACGSGEIESWSLGAC